jgi:hypothetical protein
MRVGKVGCVTHTAGHVGRRVVVAGGVVVIFVVLSDDRRDRDGWIDDDVTGGIGRLDVVELLSDKDASKRSKSRQGSGVSASASGMVMMIKIKMER